MYRRLLTCFRLAVERGDSWRVVFVCDLQVHVVRSDRPVKSGPRCPQVDGTGAVDRARSSMQRVSKVFLVWVSGR
jgi:hypothetical protein